MAGDKWRPQGSSPRTVCVHAPLPPTSPHTHRHLTHCSLVSLPSFLSSTRSSSLLRPWDLLFRLPGTPFPALGRDDFLPELECQLVQETFPDHSGLRWALLYVAPSFVPFTELHTGHYLANVFASLFAVCHLLPECKSQGRSLADLFTTVLNT